MAKLVFVSTPYASIECRERDRDYYAKELALQACSIVKQNGYEPISPVLAWMGVYSELECDKIMQNCEELIGACKYYYFHPCKWSKRSKGMAYEREIAQNKGLKTLKFSLFE